MELLARTLRGSVPKRVSAVANFMRSISAANQPPTSNGKTANSHRGTFMQNHLRSHFHGYLDTCLQACLGAAASARGRLASTALLVVFQLFTPTAWAAPFTPADAKSVRTVVEAQLAAFARDDARKAFSFAAPNVREASGSASSFLAMVRRDYPVVYRPASIAFLNPEGTGDEVLQRVQMQDASGDSWLAVYSLQRQKGNVWRITGCAVVENKGRMA